MRRSIWWLVVLASVAMRPGAAQEVAPSHLAAAEELLVLMEMEDMMVLGAEETLRLQLQQNPQLRPFADIMRDYMAEVLSWDSIGDEVIAMYAEAFTESELNELTAFYRTEIGQKTLRVLPDLMAEGMALGERAARANQAELERRIEHRVRELEK